MEKNWIEILDHEHRLIEKMLFILEKEVKNAKEGRGDFSRLAQILDFFLNFTDKCHHQKEEKVLFPILERKGIPKAGGPIGVMLMEHERGRQLLLEMKTSIDKKDGEGLVKPSMAYIELIKDHIWKEDDILYPAGKKVLSSQDTEQLVIEFEKIEEEMGEGTHQKYILMVEELETEAIKPLIYNVPLEVLAVMLDTLPFEITFIDNEDIVRYFSKERVYKIFPRSRAIIGRTVQQCHPQKSIHLVNQILNDFKSGKRDVAEFWIDHKGRKVYIRYFAVRDSNGKYLGCMEVTQDITYIKTIEGEKRLL